MTTYDFDATIERKKTDCAKWDATEWLFGQKDVIPMWVADMDFPVARPITDALKKRCEHPVFGYSNAGSDSVRQAITDRLKRKYDWAVDPEWIVMTPGIVPTLSFVLRALTRPGDAVIHQSPVYYPFWSVIEGAGCRIASNPLTYTDGRYEMDFENLRDQFSPLVRMTPASPRAKAMILCNPHNPVGRVWTREEMVHAGEIVLENGAVMVSDEIHCELIFKGFAHTPFASISKDFEQRSITCMSASKTFNLAGLDTAFLVIPNKTLRNRFMEVKRHALPEGNIFRATALQAAFNHGDDWLDQLLVYLEGNRSFLAEFFEKRIPQIRVVRTEGTYLVWIDCRGLGLDAEALAAFMNQKAKVGLDHGIAFGPEGEGFERINIACPRSLLEKALLQIETAVMSMG